MSDEANETFTMTLAGREILFRRAGIGQILMLRRLTERLKKLAVDESQDAGEDLTLGIIKYLDFIDMLIISPDDRQFVEDQMLAGNIEYTEVLKALGGGKGTEPADDEAPPSIKRAPKKSPKAAPVDLTDKKPAQIVPKPKTVASRGRTKR